MGFGRFSYLEGGDVIPFAHRGGTIDHPENTIEAFQSAIDLGYRHLETDVHASADGVLFAFHDDELERIVGIPAAISELTAAEVDAIRFDGYRVPRFDEVLATWPSANVNVDPKADAALIPLVAAVQRHQATARVCIGSFSSRRIAWCRSELGPELCTSMGPSELLRLWLHARGVPVRPPDAGCAQVPTEHKLAGRATMNFTEPAFIDAAHELAIAVHVWTINEADQMHDLVDCGVDGIMTDRPDLLRRVLTERGRWEHIDV